MFSFISVPKQKDEYCLTKKKKKLKIGKTDAFGIISSILIKMNNCRFIYYYDAKKNLEMFFRFTRDPSSLITGATISAKLNS